MTPKYDDPHPALSHQNSQGRQTGAIHQVHVEHGEHVIPAPPRKALQRENRERCEVRERERRLWGGGESLYILHLVAGEEKFGPNLVHELHYVCCFLRAPGLRAENEGVRVSVMGKVISIVQREYTARSTSDNC
jgi:hypothetical protein